MSKKVIYPEQWWSHEGVTPPPTEEKYVDPPEEEVVALVVVVDQLAVPTMEGGGCIVFCGPLALEDLRWLLINDVHDCDLQRADNPPPPGQ